MNVCNSWPHSGFWLFILWPNSSDRLWHCVTTTRRKQLVLPPSHSQSRCVFVLLLLRILSAKSRPGGCLKDARPDAACRGVGGGQSSLPDLLVAGWSVVILADLLCVYVLAGTDWLAISWSCTAHRRQATSYRQTGEFFHWLQTALPLTLLAPSLSLSLSHLICQAKRGVGVILVLY